MNKILQTFFVPYLIKPSSSYNKFKNINNYLLFNLKSSQSTTTTSAATIYTTTNSSNILGTQGSLLDKHHFQHENQYAHTIFQDHLNYKIAVPVLEQLQLENVNAMGNTTDENKFHRITESHYNNLNINELLKDSNDNNNNNNNNNKELLNNFLFIANYCRNQKLCISNEKFDKFIDIFCDQVHCFSDLEIMQSIQIINVLPETETVNKRNFSELWTALDAECVNRVDNWTLDELLLICDYWYEIRLAKICQFVWKAITKIGRRAKSLTPQQLVQLMFYCNLVRKPLLDMIDIEKRLLTVIDQLSIEELGIMCMGFFKTQYQIKNKILVNRIYEILTKNVETIQDIVLVFIIKTLRYSSSLSEVEMMTKLLDKLVIRIHDLNLLSCLHIALLGTDMQCCHRKSLELIIERYSMDLSNARLKDMERISYVIGLYDFEMKSGLEKELLQNLIVELKHRTKEIIQYPRVYISCLHYLTLKGIYDEELLNIAMDPNFLQIAYDGNIMLGKEIYHLDSFTRINLNGKYNGNQLIDKMRCKMGKNLVHYIPTRDSGYSLSHAENVMLEVKETLEQMDFHPFLIHGLPQFEKPESIIAYSKTTKKSVDLSKHYPEHYSGKILYKNILIPNENERDDIELIMVVIGGWNHFVRNQERPTGLLKLKTIQAEMIGYRTILVPWFEWQKLTPYERKIYLNLKLKSVMI